MTPQLTVQPVPYFSLNAKTRYNLVIKEAELPDKNKVKSKKWGILNYFGFQREVKMSQSNQGNSMKPCCKKSLVWGVNKWSSEKCGNSLILKIICNISVIRRYLAKVHVYWYICKGPSILSIYLGIYQDTKKLVKVSCRGPSFCENKSLLNSCIFL